MDSDSDENKYYDSAMEDKEPRPPVQQYSTSQPPSPAALQMRSMLAMWQVNSYNLLSGHYPLNPEGV